MKKILITLIITSLFWYCDRIELKEANSMAFTVQQDINYGSAYGDPAADKRRDAFVKCQNNFTALYETVNVVDEIGAWNMDATVSKTKTLTVPTGYIPISVSCFIISDDGLYITPINIAESTGGTAAGNCLLNNTAGYWVAVAHRFESKFYDSSSYSDAVMNRGYRVITYQKIPA